LPCNSSGDAAPSDYRMPPPQTSTQSFSDPSNAAPRSLAPPPGVLGSLPKPVGQEATSSSASAEAASPYRTEFDSGLNLLGKAQYDEARASFRAYADNHPKDELAPQAVFWVG